MAEAITDNAIKNIHAEAKAEGKVLTEAEFQEKFSATLEMTTDWGRLGAAVTALVTDLDANIATTTAANAVNNNLIPMLIAVGYVAYVAYDVYDTYKKEGLKAAVLKLGFEIGTGIAGGVVLKNAYKLGKIVAPTAEAAWIAYMEAHPGVAMVMNKLMGKITPAITKVTEKISAGANKVADKVTTGVKEVNDAARNLLSKGKDKVGKPGKPRNVKNNDAAKLAEKENQKATKNKVGHRKKNHLPDEGEPGSIVSNPSGTTIRKYGPDGKPQKEFNKGHNTNNPNAPKYHKEDHIHDYKPNPYHPKNKPERQRGRKVKNKDKVDLGLIKKE